MDISHTKSVMVRLKELTISMKQPDGSPKDGRRVHLGSDDSVLLMHQLHKTRCEAMQPSGSGRMLLSVFQLQRQRDEERKLTGGLRALIELAVRGSSSVGERWRRGSRYGSSYDAIILGLHQ